MAAFSCCTLAFNDFGLAGVATSTTTRLLGFAACFTLDTAAGFLALGFLVLAVFFVLVTGVLVRCTNTGGSTTT